MASREVERRLVLCNAANYNTGQVDKERKLIVAVFDLPLRF